jgi:hypothetical protein
VHEKLLLRWIECTRADECNVLRLDSTRVDQHAERHAPEVAGGRSVGCVEVAVRVEPDQRDASLPRSESLDGTDMDAAAAAEDERPLRQIGRKRKALLLERLRFHHGGLGVRELEPRRLGHRLAALAPGLWHADEAGAEAAAARVAFVVGADRHGGKRLAERALRAQPAQLTVPL